MEVVAAQFLRKSKKNRKPVGAMVILKDAEKEALRFGMVRYHPTKETEVFTKRRAKSIAVGRAEKCDFYIYTDGTTPKASTNVNRAHVIHPSLVKKARRMMDKISQKLEMPILNIIIV